MWFVGRAVLSHRELLRHLTFTAICVTITHSTHREWNIQQLSQIRSSFDNIDCSSRIHWILKDFKPSGWKIKQNISAWENEKNFDMTHHFIRTCSHWACSWTWIKQWLSKIKTLQQSQLVGKLYADLNFKLLFHISLLAQWIIPLSLQLLFFFLSCGQSSWLSSLVFGFFVKLQTPRSIWQ